MPDPSEVAEIVPVPGRNKRWWSPGGHDDENSYTVYIGTSGSDGGARYHLTVPIIVDPVTGELTTGPNVIELADDVEART